MHKNNGMKKLIAVLLALLVLVPASLFAVPVVITWEWLMEDPDVTAFRYQVDGEDPAAWTVVDSSVTSYTVEGIEGSVTHSLYLQQSYDGENWSVSAISLVEPLAAEPAPEAVAEAPVVVAEKPAIEAAAAETTAKPEAEPVAKAVTEPVAEPVVEPVVEPEPVVPAVAGPVVEPVAESVAEPAVEPVVTPVVEPKSVAAPVVAVSIPEEPVPQAVAEPAVEPAPVAVPVPAKEAETKPAYNDFSFGLDLSLGAMVNKWMPTVAGASDYKSLSSLSPAASLGFKFNNIVGLGNNFGVGLRVDAGYMMMIDGGWGSFFKDLFSSQFVDTLKGATHVATVSLMPKLDIAFGGKAGMAIEAGAEGFFSFPPIKTADAAKKVGIDWGLAAGVQFDFMLNDWFSLGLNARYHYIWNYRHYVDGRLVLGFHF